MIEVLETNSSCWEEYVDNQEVIHNIYQNIEVNKKYYSKLPFSIQNGYGNRIVLFKSLNKFMNFMIENKFFERNVEYIDLIDVENCWISLTYILFADVGIVIYVKFK